MSPRREACCPSTGVALVSVNTFRLTFSEPFLERPTASEPCNRYTQIASIHSRRAAHEVLSKSGRVAARLVATVCLGAGGEALLAQSPCTHGADFVEQPQRDALLRLMESCAIEVFTLGLRDWKSPEGSQGLGSDKRELIPRAWPKPWCKARA